EGHVIAAADLLARPHQPAQKKRGAGEYVFGGSAVAATRHVRHGNAEQLKAWAVEAVDAGAGYLHELEFRAFERLRRELRPHRWDDERPDLAEKSRHAWIGWATIEHSQSLRRECSRTDKV